MSLVRSKSLPGVGAWVGEEDSSTVPTEERGRDSGVLFGSDQPSFGSEARSSLLCELASGIALSEPPSGEIDNKESNKPELEPDGEVKKATIGRHYYPEGGWGWVVLIMSLLVQISAHGLHQATGVVLIEVCNEYKASFISASKFLTLYFL